jgi:hypothetical protein
MNERQLSTIRSGALNGNFVGGIGQFVGNANGRYKSSTAIFCPNVV